MEKMVGSKHKIFGIPRHVFKLIILLLVLISHDVYASSEVILTALDMNHKPIKQAMCQAPFILQVELRNIEGYSDIHLMQYIRGIENFKASRSMMSRNMSIDNGKKNVKIFYNFVMRADKKGNFTLGPVLLKDSSGNRIRSNRLIIPVGDEMIASEKDAKDKFFMTMTINKKQAYVGEKLTLSVKFYDRLFVDDLHLQFPDFNNLQIIKNKNNVHKNMVVFEGEEYSLTEWLFDMYATESGSLIIQDIHAAFFAPELESKFKFGGSFDFFRSLHKSQQQITAQPIKIEIMSLPPHKDFHNVMAVGQFSKFVITMNQNTVAVGQGIVVTTDLFGNGNFEMMQSPSLVLPEGFKYYDSNMVTIDEKRSYKHCEFIVQATTPGMYHIERQSLIYFDPLDAKYKVIQSNALDDITILPAEQGIQSAQIVNELDEENETIVQRLTDFSVIQQNSVHKRSQFIISIDRFNQLLWVLFLVWLLLFFYRFFFKRYVLQYRFLKLFIIFSRATRVCKSAMQQQQTYKLYPLFTDMFAQLIDITHGQVHDIAIIEYLVTKSFSDKQIQTWKRFYQQILQASFSSKACMEQDILFEQALEWIQLLKDKA